MSKIKVIIIIVLLISAILISISICKSNRESVILSQHKLPNSPCKLAEWRPEQRLFDLQLMEKTFTKAIGDTILVAFTLGSGWYVYFIKSFNNGVDWEDCIALGDSFPYRNYSYPELVNNGSRLIISFSFKNVELIARNLGYFRSTDLGATWDTLKAVFSEYTENLSYFSSLSTSGENLYYAYYKTNTDSIYVIRSTDWGDTWSDRGINVARTTLTEQNLCLTASGNYLHLVWGDDTLYRVKYSRSTDMGSTWSTPFDIASDPNGSQYPYIAVQDSHVVVCWVGYRNSPGEYAGDFSYKQSYDNGRTWDTAEELNNLHKTREVSIGLNNNLLIAAWQDIRLSDSLYDSEIIAQISTDNGQTWLNEQQLSTWRSFVTAPSIALNDNSIHISWGEQEAGEQGLYYSSSEISSGINGRGIETLPGHLSLSAYPNPFNSATTITLAGANHAEIGIYDITGRLITILHTVGGQALWDASAYSSGLYFARATGEKASTIKLILMK